MIDIISRQAAIDALGEEPEVWTGRDEYAQGLNNQWHYDVNALKAMPSAQPEKRTEKRTETHACDCISREDAKWVVFCNRDHVEDQANAIDSLPCVQPQRKKGKWYHGDAYPHHLYCSVCYRTALPNDEYVERWNLHMNYCPNCGADMRGEQDD